MKGFLDFLYNIDFDTKTIGIQKDLLLAALVGVVANLPKEVKSNSRQAVHIIVGTLLSTILTPTIIALTEQMFNITMPPQSGYGIASLIGIVGVSSIKKIIINKLSSSKKVNDDEGDDKESK
jgi:hypothetical protein